jgi:histidinol-phosphate aminotransferase
MLSALGFSFPQSGANFLFITHESIPAEELYKALKNNNIYVRYFNLPRINNYLRVSIGTENEMNILCAFLKEYINKKG